MKKLFSLAFAAVALAACTSTSKPAESSDSEPKVLVLYYSQTGATQAVAEELSSQLCADIEAIQAETPYDGDFQQTIERSRQEMESGQLPALQPLQANVSDYDLIFLGYPVWFGTCALPVQSLLQTQSFEGKQVVTFCTFGSGGLQSSTADVRAALPQAEVVEGYGVRTVRVQHAADELNRFLIEHSYKQGEVESLPAFMEHHPVTEEETAIFQAACADYQFPLGTPVSVAVRETSASTDYEFTARSQNAQGEATDATIYVTLPKAEGAKPEFTQVVR